MSPGMSPAPALPAETEEDAGKLQDKFISSFFFLFFSSFPPFCFPQGEEKHQTKKTSFFIPPSHIVWICQITREDQDVPNATPGR